MTNKFNIIFSGIVTFFLKYGFKYIATIFLIWAFIFVFVILLMSYISAFGAPKIPHFIIVYLESNFPSGIKGSTVLEHNDLMLIFMKIALVIEILNEIIKFVIRKYYNPVKMSLTKSSKGYFGKLGVETQILAGVFSGSSILLIMGNRLDMSIFSKILSIFILYALSLIFIKTYKTLDYAAENLK